MCSIRTFNFECSPYFIGSMNQIEPIVHITTWYHMVLSLWPSSEAHHQHLQPM